MNYVAYTDESYISAERYRSICAFSFKKSNWKNVRLQLKDNLTTSDVKEFKWQKLKTAKYKFCAEKFIDSLFDLIKKAGVRIDVLLWDTQDSRHKVINRDDTLNFERMFFHLLRDSMIRRGKNLVWEIYPDEKLDIDWLNINKCLSSIGKRHNYIEYPLFGDLYKGNNFKIRNFRQVKSHEHPCCQLADFMAGIAVFSKNHYELYRNWLTKDIPLLPIFDESSLVLTNRQKTRIEILDYLLRKCKNHKLGVSISKKQCLYTPNPNNPINFWFYTPQHKKDKAPTRH